MTEAEFVASFPTESTFVERKSGVGHRIPGEVVAFSNTDGGVILIGVDDTGNIVGRALTAAVEDDLHQRIRETSNPGRYSIHGLTVGTRPSTARGVAPRTRSRTRCSRPPVYASHLMSWRRWC